MPLDPPATPVKPVPPPVTVAFRFSEYPSLLAVLPMDVLPVIVELDVRTLPRLTEDDGAVAAASR